MAEDVGEKKEEGEPISRGMGLGTWGGSVALAVLEVEMLRLISAREEAVVAYCGDENAVLRDVNAVLNAIMVSMRCVVCCVELSPALMT